MAVWEIPGPDSLSEDEAGAFLLFPLQYGAMVGALAWITVKGRRSLRLDFGFEIRPRDALAVLAGLGWQLALVIVLVPFVLLLDTTEPSQETLRVLEDSQSAGVVAALAIGAVLVAPVVEEVLFRGLLLRALLRRLPPWVAVVVSGGVFGAVHLGGASGLLAVATVVGLTGFGMLLAVQALRTGSLSRPILTHVGFNLAGFLITLL